MKLSDITRYGQRLAILPEITASISGQNNEIVISGLSGSSKGYLLSTLLRNKKLPILIITSDDESAFTWLEDMKAYTSREILHFPGKEILPYEDIEPMVELTAERLLVLQKLIEYKESPQGNEPPVVIVSIRELQEKMVPMELYKSMTQSFVFGEDYEIDKIALKLAEAGYERVPLVEQRGQFAIRGGILDVFNTTSDDPYRLEFYGNTLESIRTFRVSNQRSKEEVETVTIAPASESEIIDYALSENIALANLSDYFSADSLIVFDEPMQIQEKQKEHYKLYEERHQQTIKEKRKEPAPESLIYTFPEILESAGNRNLFQFSLLENPKPLKAGDTSFRKFDIPTQSVEAYRGQYDRLAEHIKKWQEESYHLFLVCDNQGQKDRFIEILREKEIFPEELDFVSDTEPEITNPAEAAPHYPVYITLSDISSGFISKELKIAILTDREIFTRYSRVRHFRRFKEGAPITDVMELQPGDFIVHIDHGIGKYMGLKQMTIDNHPADFLMLEYADGDKLYVPIQQIYMVQKYIAKDEANPNLNQLGDKTWQKTKHKAKESIQKMAKELLLLYGMRQMAQGHSFANDTIWQNEFEASFPYEETRDQLKAIAEIKEDMQNEKPMDRLLCGDVGFGKTEVAIRAAFKAVMDKKQVAVLVPTTILAQQHWYTFSERLAEYPVSVEMISRFRSPIDVKRTIEGLENGSVDIVIGTHRILSKDIKFKNLGLVIVDEEQRFGVTHKEKLKQLKKEIDVLTLTATPIPRTLYMSLSGIRDLSIINTPPEDRLPIQTTIHRFEPKVIREAVMREMHRGGQVYFVHNRVQSIYQMADKIQEIVPEARIIVGHGQMSEKELEKVMLDFISKRYDILIATTIIESGLDIPNCNTIIINRADALGLSQLYQLRGRVGRDRHQAYAYLLIPSQSGITSIATRRLQTLQEYTELGSGYRIAMRDLEIRGMGNLLGADQSGHMEAIGFDLYCKLVEQTIAELKGEAIPESPETKIDVPLQAIIPSDYVPDEKQKFNLYRKLAAAQSPDDIKVIEEELIDRFGPLPTETQNLLEIVKVRVEATKLGIIYIRLTRQMVQFQWFDKAPAYAFQAFHGIKGIEIHPQGTDQIVLVRTQAPTKDAPTQLQLLLKKLKAAASTRLSASVVKH
jgi:transcription-repair coupling factor (superfamily II helicase)